MNTGLGLMSSAKNGPHPLAIGRCSDKLAGGVYADTLAGGVYAEVYADAPTEDSVDTLEEDRCVENPGGRLGSGGGEVGGCGDDTVGSGGAGTSLTPP